MDFKFKGHKEKEGEGDEKIKLEFLMDIDRRTLSGESLPLVGFLSSNQAVDYLQCLLLSLRNSHAFRKDD